MRNAEDNCLLCQVNKATKTNSHIVPKFLTKNLFAAGDKRRGFQISSGSADKPPLFLQDSSKENYILCPDCENYFSVLETEASRNFYTDLWKREDGPKHSTHMSRSGFLYRDLLLINPKLFHLFIFSIIWRCSISSHALFERLNVSAEEKEKLRQSLMLFKALTLVDVLNKIQNQADNLVPMQYIMLTSVTFSDQTSNVIFTPKSSRNPCYLWLNQFILMFSFEPNEMQQKFAELENTSTATTLVKVSFLRKETWDQFMQILVHRYANASKKNLDLRGAKPYFLPEEKLKIGDYLR